MNVVFSLILLAAALGCIVFLLTRRENARRSQYGPSGRSVRNSDRPAGPYWLRRVVSRRESRYTMMPSAQAKRQTETTAFMERPSPKEFSLL